MKTKLISLASVLSSGCVTLSLPAQSPQTAATLLLTASPRPSAVASDNAAVKSPTPTPSSSTTPTNAPTTSPSPEPTQQPSAEPTVSPIPSPTPQVSFTAVDGYTGWWKMTDVPFGLYQWTLGTGRIGLSVNGIAPYKGTFAAQWRDIRWDDPNIIDAFPDCKAPRNCRDSVTAPFAWTFAGNFPTSSFSIVPEGIGEKYEPDGMLKDSGIPGWNPDEFWWRLNAQEINAGRKPAIVLGYEFDTRIMTLGVLGSAFQQFAASVIPLNDTEYVRRHVSPGTSRVVYVPGGNSVYWTPLGNEEWNAYSFTIPSWLTVRTVIYLEPQKLLVVYDGERVYVRENFDPH